MTDPYRQPVASPECICKLYPKGTLFQELDDDPDFYKGDSDITRYRQAAPREFGEPKYRWVRMQHTPQCIAYRQSLVNGTMDRGPIKIMFSGMDYADGAWWCWSSDVEPPPESPYLIGKDGLHYEVIESPGLRFWLWYDWIFNGKTVYVESRRELEVRVRKAPMKNATPPAS